MQPHDEDHEERKPHPDPEQRPEQPRPGFATGQAQGPESPEDEREPDFARGQNIEQEPGTEKHGRFSTGQELTPDDDPIEDVQRRYSEGHQDET